MKKRCPWPLFLNFFQLPFLNPRSLQLQTFKQAKYKSDLWHPLHGIISSGYTIIYSNYFLFFGINVLLGWPKSPFSFFHKVEDTWFIFTNSFIDLDILSTLAVERPGVMLNKLCHSQLKCKLNS